MSYIAGIGGANMDIHAQTLSELIMEDSNPGSIHMSMGGVCRNVCENLARLGEEVHLVTVVGNDANGRSILDGCEEAGIHMEASEMIDGENSSMYVSILNHEGNMVLAMSDMHIIKRLDDRLVDRARKTICNADMVMCDGNLSPKSLQRLTQVCASPLYMDPVSVAWAREIQPYIGFFDTVKPNRLELSVLSGYPCDTLEEITLACDVLRGKGVKRVFVSLGKEGMFYRGPEGSISKQSRPYPNLVNATGAGDAAMAGIAFATRRGWSAEQTVNTAMAAGMIAIASEDTINTEISPEKIEDIIRKYID